MKVRPAQVLAVALLAAAPAARAAALRYCDAPAPLDATQKDTLLRFGAIIKAELDRSGASVALVSRSGLDLSRFGMRYSHAGVSLRASPETPWAVRQLYYACDEHKPRIYDQGMAAFLMGSQEAGLGYVSVLLLPAPAAAALEQAALDKPRALGLLGRSYSANAYPFSVSHQNCNQWVVELLAAAWGGLDDGDDSRERAQGWLKTSGYEPTVFDVGWRPLMWASALVPWLHRDDHPDADLADSRYRVSMPASIEAFVLKTVPGARRIEFCHTDRQVVVRRGGAGLIDEGCSAGPQDEVIVLD